jgi:hypothetical protein
MTTKPLSDDVQAMIDTYRRQGRATERDAEAVWRGIESALPLAPLGGAALHAHQAAQALPSGVALKAGAAGKLWLVAGLGVGLTVGGVGWWGTQALQASLSRPGVPAAPSGAKVTSVSEPSDVRPPEPVAGPPASVTSRPARTPDPPAPSRGTDRRPSDERRRLDDARAALTRRDAAAALVAIDEHQRKYPSGWLSEERESLRVQAWVMAHDEARARAAGEAFLRRFPDSLYRSAVEHALQNLK